MDKSAESATSHASGIQLIACLLRRDFKVDREGRESNGLRTDISTSVRLFEAGHVQALRRPACKTMVVPIRIQ